MTLGGHQILADSTGEMKKKDETKLKLLSDKAEGSPTELLVNLVECDKVEIEREVVLQCEANGSKRLDSDKVDAKPEACTGPCARPSVEMEVIR